jgi:hypothetical protein
MRFQGGRRLEQSAVGPASADLRMAGVPRPRAFSNAAWRSTIRAGEEAREDRMSDVATPAKKYASFAEFYPFYLSEHSDRTCRRLHFAGSTLALICLVALLVTRNPWWLLAGLVCGYGFAWLGHFVFEKNHPASFKQPLYSLMGDWKMFWQIVTGKIAF